MFLDKIYQSIPFKIRDKINRYSWNKAKKIVLYLLQTKERLFQNDDVLISYLDFGNKGGETIVFLHGFSDNKYSFFRCARYLLKDYRIIVPDIPGFGDSSKDEVKIYNSDQYSRWVHDFLKSMNLKNIHLAGNSLGGAIALKLVINDSEMFKTLLLVDAAGVVPDNSNSIYDELKKGESPFLCKDGDDFSLLMKRVFERSPRAPLPLQDFFRREYIKNYGWFSKLTDDLFNDLLDNGVKIFEDIRTINIKTSIFWGREDKIFPVDTAYKLSEIISGSKIKVFDGLGHCPQIEAPKEFSKAYRAFLESL